MPSINSGARARQRGPETCRITPRGRKGKGDRAPSSRRAEHFLPLFILQHTLPMQILPEGDDALYFYYLCMKFEDTHYYTSQRMQNITLLLPLVRLNVIHVRVVEQPFVLSVYYVCLHKHVYVTIF
jgi:hypothetical protein